MQIFHIKLLNLTSDENDDVGVDESYYLFDSFWTKFNCGWKLFFGFI